MSLGSAIYGLLRTNSTVVSTFGTRIYPIVIPQEASAKIPAITYQQTGISPNDVKDKYSTVWNVRSVQLITYAQSFQLAEVYCDLIELVMIRYKGTIGGETIKTIDLVDESFDFVEDFTISGDGKGIGVFSCTMNFNIITE